MRYELVGKTFGKLTVLAKHNANAKNGNVLWVCHCNCKNFCLVKTNFLTKRGKTDCGCEHKKNISVSKVKHGYKYSKVYGVVDGVIRRCHDTNKDNYKHYGAKGIFVCGEWRSNREIFCEWLEENGYREGLQIDRIDNDKGYSPENCRLLPQSFNSINKVGFGQLNCNGVTFRAKCGQRPFETVIRLYGKTYRVGYYDTLFEAACHRKSITNNVCNVVAQICKDNVSVEVNDLKPLFIDALINEINKHQ